MKKHLVVANWKMYIEDGEAAATYAKSLRAKMRAFPNIAVSIAPSFILIPRLVDSFKRSNIAVGAQAVSASLSGAHTGEVSAAMLKKAGVAFSMVGHSERRALGETNEIVRAQMFDLAKEGLGAILCIGERERDQSGEHFSFIQEQLVSALAGLPRKAISKLVIAYEPVWAIGKSASDAMSSSEIQEAVIFIRKTLNGLLEPAVAKKVPILYGGSVEENNAGKILKEGGVNGFLVGHASAHLENFLPILKAIR
jgi:triosephosphate isomerase